MPYNGTYEMLKNARTRECPEMDHYNNLDAFRAYGIDEERIKDLYDFTTTIPVSFSSLIQTFRSKFNGLIYIAIEEKELHKFNYVAVWDELVQQFKKQWV